MEELCFPASPLAIKRTSESSTADPQPQPGSPSGAPLMKRRLQEPPEARPPTPITTSSLTIAKRRRPAPPARPFASMALAALFTSRLRRAALDSRR
jgi:hypothetical protein